MRAVLCIAALCGLAGCQSLEDLQRTAPNASNMEICRAAFLAPGNVAAIARNEAVRRGLDCQPYLAAVMQQEQARNQAINALSRQLLAPAPTSTPQTVTCESYRYGVRVETTCR